MGAQDEINTTSDAQITSNEKIPVVMESDDAVFNKSELHIDDEAGEIAAQALASGPADSEDPEAAIGKENCRFDPSP